MLTAKLASVFVISFVVLLAVSFLPSQVETWSHNQQSYCQPTHYLCSPPYEKSESSSTVTRGRGYPFLALKTSQTKTLNGISTGSNTIMPDYVGLVLNITVIALVSLVIASISKLTASIRKDLKVSGAGRGRS